MKSTTWLIGFLLSVLSVVMLIKHGFEVSFVSSLQLLLDFYEANLQVLVGWLEPWIRELHQSLRGWFGWDLMLYPHWRHILILMGLYTVRGSALAFAAGNRGSAAFGAGLGLAIALLCSLIAGSIPFRAADQEMALLIATVPVIGLAAYGIFDAMWLATWFRPMGYTWWQLVGEAAGSIAWLSAVMLSGIALALRLPSVQQLPNPGVAMLAVVVGWYAAYWIWSGVRIANATQKDGETWRGAFLRSGNGRFGIAILGVFGAALLFVLTNAGLKLAGL